MSAADITEPPADQPSRAPLTTSYLQADADAVYQHWCVGDLLRDAVARGPQEIALIVPASADGRPERSWSYSELAAAATNTAQALLGRFKPGDRIATWAGSSAEVVLLQLGAALAGIVLVTLNPANRAAELRYLLEQSEARGLFLDRVFRKLDNAAVIAELQPSLPLLETIVYVDQWQAFTATSSEQALPRVAHDAAAMIVFTSGTTGKPKGAVLRHSGIVNNARFSTARMQLPEGSVWLNVLPMFHIGGSVTMTLGCLANGGTQVLVPEFSPDAVLGTLEHYRVQVTMAVPTMLVAMLEHERCATADLSHLQVIVTGGTVVAPELVREVQRRMQVEMMVLFGQTEAGGCMCLTRRGDDLPRVTQSVGTPLPLSEAMIVIPGTRQIAPLGEIGEICVRTPCAMMEYFKMPTQTREALDDAGWIHTGDLGLMRADGYLQVTGRLKDMIIRGGENIYPREIEDALMEHASVSQAAVFGVPDYKWGEQVAAAIVLKPGSAADAEQLTAFLQQKIARHKTPKAWQFLTALPVNASGKIQKFILREQYVASHRDTP